MLPWADRINSEQVGVWTRTPWALAMLPSPSPLVMTSVRMHNLAVSLHNAASPWAWSVKPYSIGRFGPQVETMSSPFDNEIPDPRHDHAKILTLR